MKNFEYVERHVSDPVQLEHVTKYYHDYPDESDFVNVTSEEVYDDPRFRERTDLRLTLDELADYLLLRKVFKYFADGHSPSFAEVVQYINEKELVDVNATVAQKGSQDEDYDQG